MKNAFKWIGIALGLGIAGAVAYEVVQTVRTNLKASLTRAEGIAEKTQDLISETKSALDAANQAI